MDEYVGGGVSFREAVPVPVGNVGRDSGKNSGDKNKAGAPDEIVDPGLSEKEDNEDRFEKFGGEFNAQRFAQAEGPAGRIIHENARWIGREFFVHVFHRFLFLLPGRVRAETGPRKNIKAAIFANVRLHRIEHSRFIGNFTDAYLAQRQKHMRDRRPDKHDDAAQNTGKKNFHRRGLKRRKWKLERRKGKQVTSG